jgi:hypothetical protein
MAIALGIGKSSAQNSATDVANEIKANGGTQGTCYNTPTTSRFYAACSTLADDNNKVNTDATVANVGIGIGIAGAGFATFWFIWALTHNSHKETTAAPAPQSSFTPFVGPHLNGLAFSASF